MRRSGRGCRGCSKRKPAARKRRFDTSVDSDQINRDRDGDVRSACCVCHDHGTHGDHHGRRDSDDHRYGFRCPCSYPVQRHRRHRLLNRPGSRCCRQRCGPTRYRPLRPGHRQWRLLCGCGGLHRPHRPLRHLRLRRSQNRCCRRSADRRPSRVPHPMLRLRLTQGCLPRRAADQAKRQQQYRGILHVWNLIGMTARS